jgi:hypothetical protein
VKDLIQKVISEVREGQSTDFHRTLLQAALLLEKHHIPECEWRGIEPDIDDAEVADTSTEELRQAPMSFAKGSREHPDVGGALWALRKCWGRPLREFFIDEMKAHLAAKRLVPLFEADHALFHFGGGTHYNFSYGEANYDAYYESCQKFLDEQSR